MRPSASPATATSTCRKRKPALCSRASARSYITGARVDAVRLEIESSAGPEIVDRLQTNFELDPWQVFKMDGPVNLTRLMNLYGETNRPSLKYPPFKGTKV